MRKRAAKNPSIAIGAGSGGNQRGAKNHRYKDGRSQYRKCFEADHPEQRCCEVCADTRNLVVHHIDRNRRNNSDDNLMMLCRRCHAEVHGVAANLGETPMLYKNKTED